MFLTKIKIKTENIYKFKNDYETHRTVCSYLKDPQEHHLFLKRESDVLVLSTNKPEGEGLETKEIPSDYVGPGLYRFRVKVNAVKTKDNQRIPLVGFKQINKWFEDRSEKWGVSFKDLSFLGTEKSTSVKKVSKKESEVTVYGSTVAGILEVKDAETFIKVFEQGIGKARRLGYGMLELVKA